MDRTSYTGAEFVSSGTANLVGYGWGLEVGPEWTPVIDPGSNLAGVAMLTSGVSLVVIGVPGAEPGSDLAACVQPLPRKSPASKVGGCRTL